jgi:WD40 repeat protein
VGPNHVLLGPMGAGELRRAIEGPAERAGLGVEPTLVDALVSDVAGEPGGLPLLSTALIDLWRERDGTMLTFAAYEVTGGVRGAVGRHAEAAFRSLDADEQRVARRILLRLVAGGDAEALTRRRVQRRELDTDHDPQIAGVLAALVERRLVVADEAAVELVHEALLDQWPRLVTWIDEDVQGRRLHRHLTESATEWEAGGRDVGELFRGARLAATLEWAEAAGDAAALNRLERAFLEASRTAFARANRRLQALLALAVILLAAAVIAGIAALAARGSARNQATVAVAQRLGAQALVEPDLDRSLLLAREALRLDDAQATRGNLLAALLRGPAALAVAHPGGQRVVDAALDPTGRTLAVRANDGGVAFFRAQSLRRLADRVFTNGENVHFGAVARPLRAIAYSPDGRVLAAGDSDGSHATLVLIDAVMHEKRAYRTSPDNAVTTDLVYAVDGRTLVTGEAVTGRVSPPPARIVVRRASDGVALRQSRPIPGGRLVGFGPGGRSLVVTSGENVTYLLDVATFRRIRTFRASGAPALSPSRRLAVFGGASGAVRVADLRTGRLRTLGRTPGRVTSVSFGPGDGTFATGADDGTVAVWDTAAGLRETLTGLTAAVVALVFGRGGHTLYSGSADGTVVAWDVSAQRRLARPFGFAPVGTPRAGGSAGRGAATAVAVSSDGSLVATQPAPDRVTLWRAADMSMLAELRGPCGSLDSLAFSHDGRRLAGTGDARQTVVWNVGTRRVARLLGPAGNGGASGVGFSPDDRLVATAGVDGALRVYDVGSALEIATVKVQGSLQDVDFSADGKLLVAAGLGGQVIVWDVRQHRVVRRIAQPDLIFAIRMSPDGKTVVTGDSAGNVRFWDAGSGRRAGRTLGGQNGAAVSVTFDPTGTELVTTSSDGKVRLWDLQTAKLVGAPLDFSERGGWGWGTYFPDGKRVIAVFDSGVGVVWDVDPTAWARQACRIANRDLTRAEWHDFLPNRRPASVCGRFSAARA